MSLVEEWNGISVKTESDSGYFSECDNHCTRDINITLQVVKHVENAFNFHPEYEFKYY